MISTIANVRIAGIASAVPEQTRACAEAAEQFGAEEIAKMSATTGVFQRHVAGRLCTSDLCLAAARRLLDGLGWPAQSVDVLIFVSQTPDYLVPATACCLHERLGLGKSGAAFDMNLGCSGYVYGLWTASSLMVAGARRALLLVGDTSTRTISPEDRSVALLFGDAGSATALEYSAAAPPTTFSLGTDGSGQEHLMIKAGLFRNPRTAETGLRTLREGGNRRSDEDLYMNGAEVFTFTLREVPGLLQSVLEAAGWQLAGTDAVVMHQANQFMLTHLAKRLKISPEKLPLVLKDYGNTSSASIPLALTESPICRPLQEREMKLVLAGFGVGFSWAAAAVQCGPLVLAPLSLV